jgi:hypothetical protein
MLGGMWQTPDTRPAALVLLLSRCCGCGLNAEKLPLALLRCSLLQEVAVMRGLLLLWVLPRLTSSSTEAADLQQQQQQQGCKQVWRADRHGVR